MGPQGRILYLVQLDAAEAATTWQVAQFAKAWQSPVVLLGIRRARWLSFIGNEEQRAMKRELLGVARRLRELKAHVTGIRVATGDAVAETARLAGMTGAALIAVGAGPGAATGAVAPVAQAVAMGVSRDVLIVRPDADPHLEHVLCAADTTPLAGLALQRAVEICRRFNSRLRVVSVLAEPAPPRGAGDPEELASAATRAQKHFLNQFDLGGVPLSRAIAWGAASVELLLEAERYADGLLVLGASGGGARDPELGATTETMVRACPSSVLIVRRRKQSSGHDAPGTEVATTESAGGG